MMKTHLCCGVAGALALVVLCGLFGITAARAGVPGHRPSPVRQPILDSAIDSVIDELPRADAAPGAQTMVPQGLPGTPALRRHAFVDSPVHRNNSLFPSQVTRTYLPPPAAS